jgi:hypothetical protein
VAEMLYGTLGIVKSCLDQSFYEVGSLSLPRNQDILTIDVKHALNAKSVEPRSSCRRIGSHVLEIKPVSGTQKRKSDGGENAIESVASWSPQGRVVVARLGFRLDFRQRVVLKASIVLQYFGNGTLVIISNAIKTSICSVPEIVYYNVSQTMNEATYIDG